MRFVFVLAILAASGGCASIRPEFRAAPRGIEDDDRMIETVRELIPDGTTIAEAQRLMERQGFRCRLVSNGSFVSMQDWEELWLGEGSDKRTTESLMNGPKGRTGLDFLLCERDEGFWAWESHTWRLALVHREGKVVEVLADPGWSGL